MPREDRPGRPRRYCSPSHQQAAANKRRPVTSPAIAVLEDAVLQADSAVQAARADVKAAAEKVTAARRKLQEGKAARLREVKAAEQSRFHASWETPTSPDVVAQQAVAKALALVDRTVEAWELFEKGQTDDRKAAYNQARDAAEADPLAKLKIGEILAEQKRAPAEAAAEAASAAAESARAALQTARARLDRRAQQARIRRARAGGGDPEEIEPGEIETESEGIEPAPDTEETAVFPSWSRHAQG